MGTAAWRPPQWRSVPSFTMMPLPQNGSTTPAETYVFDGVITAEHEQQSVVTLNPVQTGAALTDHVYVLPPRLTIEIEMSDSMQSYKLGQWTGAPSRSVAAYQTLSDLQQKNTPVSISTPLRQYPIMMITELRAPQSKDTRYALKATVTFTGILTALVTQVQSSDLLFTNPDSSLHQTTNQTVGGQIQQQAVPAAVDSQNNIANAPPPFGNPPGMDAPPTGWVPFVPGSGNWSSDNVNVLPELLK